MLAIVYCCWLTQTGDCHEIFGENEKTELFIYSYCFFILLWLYGTVLGFGYQVMGSY